MKTQFGRHPRARVVYFAMILALILGMAPQALPGVETPTAEAHNLQTKMVYMFLDPDTQSMLDNRIAGPPAWTPGTPLLQVNDVIGLIIKVVPRDGTTTGVGGHIDFYVPNGATVIDTAYLLPGDSVADGITGYDGPVADRDRRRPHRRQGHDAVDRPDRLDRLHEYPQCD